MGPRFKASSKRPEKSGIDLAIPGLAVYLFTCFTCCRCQCKSLRLLEAHFDTVLLRNPGRDISFPIFIRKEIETRKLERKLKQKISRFIDLLYRLNDIISR